jgi:hypothetical protein
MPPPYRGSIIFVDDSQGYADLRAFLDDMREWADTFNLAELAKDQGVGGRLAAREAASITPAAGGP